MTDTDSNDCSGVPVTQKDGVRADQAIFMPILKKEPDLYPPDLMEEQAELLLLQGKSWWALYTRSRREKDLMRRLVKLQVPFYGPVIEQRHRSPSGRLRTSYSPLFSNYVFVCGDDSDRYNALTTGCVSRDLLVTDPTALVHDLREIHSLINTGVDLTPEAHIEVGERVRVKSGPLENRVGVVIERRGKRRLLVAVDFLQQGASVELEHCELERL